MFDPIILHYLKFVRPLICHPYFIDNMPFVLKSDQHPPPSICLKYIFSFLLSLCITTESTNMFILQELARSEGNLTYHQFQNYIKFENIYKTDCFEFTSHLINTFPFCFQPYFNLFLLFHNQDNISQWIKQVYTSQQNQQKLSFLNILL